MDCRDDTVGLGLPGASRWRPRRMPRAGRTPRLLREWLDEPGSLTRRMRRACGERFRVHVLKERWGRPWRDEGRRLLVPAHRRVWLREVLLCNGAEPWIYARTVIPEHVLSGRLRRLRHLGRQPLGAVLFGRHRLTRGPIEVASLGPGDALFHQAAAHVSEPADLWARRSVFRAERRPLLVTEVFLPGLVRYAGGRAEEGS